MANQFRAPKAVQLEAEGNTGELAKRIAEPLTIEDILEIRNTWNGDAGIEWAKRLAVQLEADARVLRGESATGDTPESAEVLAQIDAIDGVLYAAFCSIIDAGCALQDLRADFVAEETDEAGNTIEMNSAIERYTEKRASAARIGEGTFVSWESGGERVRGKVEKVITKGQATSTDGFTIEATPEQPAFQIRVYESKGNGYIAGDTVVVHRNDYLTVIGALPAPRSAGEADMIEERKAAIATAEKITMSSEIRAIDTTDGTLKIAGYAATFDREAEGLNFREMIKPGAFKRCLSEGRSVYLLINHDTAGIPLASTESGTLRLFEDGVGLRMEADLDPANPKAQEFASAIRRGDMTKMSFSFSIAPGGEMRDGGLRMLTDIDVHEVSGVTWPAYASTDLSMRSQQEIDDEAAAKAALELRHRIAKQKARQLSLRK